MNPVILRIILTALGGAVGAVGQMPNLQGTPWAAILAALGGIFAGGALFRRPGDMSLGDILKGIAAVAAPEPSAPVQPPQDGAK